MKFSSLSFRDMDRKFFKLLDKKASELLLMGEGEDDCDALLYCYINPDALITFDIIGYESNDKRVLFSDGKPRKVYIDFIYESKCEEIKDKQLQGIKQVSDAQKFYTDETLVSLREIDGIDSARDPFAPDVLNITVILGKKAYATKGKICGINPDGKLFCNNLCALPCLQANQIFSVDFAKVDGSVVAFYEMNEQ